MGLLDGVKSLYFAIEERYYGVLDKVNTYLPVYDVIDPIDKVVPSLVLFGVIALLIIGGIAYSAFGNAPSSNSLTVTVKDGDTALQGASVTFKIMGNTTAIPPSETDASGNAVLPGLKSGDSVQVDVTSDGYVEQTKTILIGTLPQNEVMLMQKQSEAFTTKTIRLVDSDLGLPIKESLTLKFSCSNPYAKAPGDIKLAASDKGTADVKVPNNCDSLSVSVSNTNRYKEVSSQPFDQQDMTIRLSEQEAPGGTLSVNVADTSGNPLDGINVKLYRHDDLVKNADVGPIDQSATSGGKAAFQVPAGSYEVKTYDPAGVYGDSASGTITVGSNETKAVSLSLQESIRGTITIAVTDASTGSAISGAKVTLVYTSTGSELSDYTTDSNGTAVFSIAKDTDYTAIVYAGTYQLVRMSGLRISPNAVKAALGKCTPSTCGSLQVNVVDQSGEPVRNAVVSLYSAQTNYLAGYGTRTTDINGMAKFFGVSAGNYYAFAFTGTFSGKSDTTFFSGSDQNNGTQLTVKVDVGEGAVQVNARDTDGNPVPFAQVNLFDSTTDEQVASDFTDSNGMKEFDGLKANREVYAVVSKNDQQAVYALYTTAKKPLLPSTVQVYNVTLEKPVLKENIGLEFLGLYSGDKTAGKVQAGSTYTARFKLRVPEEKNYTEAGVHLRTGNDVMMEKDGLFLKEINAPNTSQVRATRFENQASGLDEPDYQVTAGDAKWANLRWRSPQAGVYELEAQVSVKGNASVGDKLPLYYRAWGIKDDGTRDRYPIDNNGGTELYSSTLEQLFQAGVESLCDKDFCFTSSVQETRQNNNESLAQTGTDTFNTKVFNPYKLVFVLTNNSDTRIHNKAVLEVANPDKSVKFFDYTFIDAAGQETGGVANDYNFSAFNVGDMGPHNSVRLETDFTPQKAVNETISIRLVSDNAIAYEKSLTIATGAPNELDVDVEPKVYLSGVQNDITVTAKDKATGLEVSGATVKLLDRRGNVLAFTTTAGDGTAKLTVPGGAPGEGYKVRVEMPDYSPGEVDVSVSDQVLSISPPQLGVSLNVKTKQESDDKVTATNVTPYALTIQDVSLEGDFKNLLDTQKITNWLDASYKGMVLQPGDKQDIILKSFVSQDAIALQQTSALDATLAIVAGNFGQQWVFRVPAKIAIGIGGEVDNPACLVVTKKDWTASSNGTPTRIEFQVQNNCTVNGKPVALHNLEAEVQWKTNQLGDYTINVGSEDQTLRAGYFRLLLGTIEPEQALNSYMTFTPFGGVNGLNQAAIVIQASNPLEGQDQVLSQTINTSINSVKLSDCITYDKERLTVNQQQSGTVTVTTNNCGEPITFGIDSDLKTSPAKQFTVKDGESKSIEVFAENNYPGQYGLFLSPKFASEKKQQLVKDIKVIINQPGCWQVSKYEFDVYDDPKNPYDGIDTADLANSCVQRPVDVKVNTKDFMQALKNGLFWGLVSGGIVMASNVADGRTLSGTTPPAGYKPWTSYLNPINWFKGSGNSGKSDKPGTGGGGTGSPGGGGQSTPPGGGSTPPASSGGGGSPLVKGKQQGTSTPTGLAVAVTGLPTGYGANTAPAAPSTPQQGAQAPAQQQTNPLNNVPQVAAAGAAPSLMGGLFGGAGGLVTRILGPSPWAAGIFGTAIGTLVSYTSQPSETHFTLMANDAEVQSVRLVQGSGTLKQDDPSIKLDTEGLGSGPNNAPVVPQPLTNNQNVLSQGIETVKLVFTNIGGKLITSYERPHYATLQVDGIRHNYTDKTYSKGDFFDEKGGFLFFFQSNVLNKTKKTLDEDKPQQLEQNYRLEFNSVPPQVETTVGAGLLNCQDGTRIGSTGNAALPKVKFTWSWSGDDRICNEDNTNGVYCDATQFSIALLKKIHMIDAYVSANGPAFQCPSASEEAPATSVIENFDIGISSLAIVPNGNDVQVQAKVKNTNPGTIQSRVSLSIRNPLTNSTVQCQGGAQSITVASGGETEADCTFRNLAPGTYEADASIVPSVSCQNCQDKSSTNTLSRNFTVGVSGTQACQPYSTTRLADFLNSSGKKADNIVNLTSFNALLMGDGYSTGFQRDFDTAQNQTFFSAPDYYTNQSNGLGLYFRNPTLLSFDAYSQPDFTLPGPGTYHVSIDITYKDSSWSLFDQKGNPDANIIIHMTKLHGAEPDSPFYYLPLDGLVGQKTGRVGYGVNFNGDSIVLDNSRTPVRTVEIPGSSPITNGILTVTRSDDFKSMQVDNRGVVARLTRANGNPQLLFQPSNATPVMLQMTKKSGSDAYAIYQVGVGAPENGNATDVGPTLALWNGIGATCRGFDDSVMSQQQFVPDTHGISTRCAIVGQNQRSKYALEFCGQPVDFGTASYETVFYTPQGKEATVQLVDAASDTAQLFGVNGSGSIIKLNGNNVTPEISSLQDVFNLVSQGYMCVSGTNINSEFFWNPKQIFDNSFQSQETAAINACIGPKVPPNKNQP